MGLADPLATALGLRRALKGSRLVTVDEGQGHGVYSLGISACADDVATRYLTTGRLPARDVTCAADPLPAADSRSTSQGPATAPARLPFSGR